MKSVEQRGRFGGPDIERITCSFIFGGPTMAIITRKNRTFALCIAGVVVMTCDTLREAEEWLQVLGLTYSVRYI